MKTRIVVVGGGFAGLEFVKRIGDNDRFQVTLVDVNNYNFFPPLIYQVSTGFMEPSAISYPFRKILAKKKHARFRLGELLRVIPEENKVVLSNGDLFYDVLVMATGTESNFFGNENIKRDSLPMKTISDALSLRNTILTRLDRATRQEDREERKKLLSFVVAGAGPTGVELSGILAEMRANVMRKDYPELSEEDLGEIYLIDGNPAVLAVMSEKAQKYTYEKLAEQGVQIILNTRVDNFEDGKVTLSDGKVLYSKNLIWTAGVKAKTFEGFSPESIGRGGRLKADGFNLVEGYDNIYALGDCALILTDKLFPDGHPQLAQPALQQAKNLSDNLTKPKSSWKSFEYNDKGSMAIIGRNKAVLDSPHKKVFIKGFLAWLVWIFVHIMGLVNFKNRIRAFFDWIGYYMYRDQSFRMIIKPNEKPKNATDN